MERAAVALGDGDESPAAGDAYAHAFDHWLASGAPDLDERLPAVMAELGLDVGTDALMTSLSGGQAARAALAALLLSRFDLCCSTSPPTTSTSLDSSAGGVRARAALRGRAVSHDREFLSRVVTRVVELDLAQHQVAVYDGGYDAFLEEREIARRHAGRSTRSTPSTREDLVSRAAPSGSGAPKGSATPSRRPGQRQDPPQGVAWSPRRSRHRRSARWNPGSPPRGGRRTPQGVGAPLHDRQCPALQLVVATLDAATASLGSFTFGRPHCRSMQVTGSASPAPTAPARRRCCGSSSDGSRRSRESQPGRLGGRR